MTASEPALFTCRDSSREQSYFMQCIRKCSLAPHARRSRYQQRHPPTMHLKLLRCRVSNHDQLNSGKRDATSRQHLLHAEVDEALEQISPGRFQALLLSCICLVWAGDAAEVMVLSFLGPAASCNLGFHSPSSQSLLASAVFGGMLLGAACWGFLADELGRRRTLLASTAVVVGAGLASSAAPTPTLLLLSRACVGFGLAGAPVAFTLMMELLPVGSRATWGVLIELAWTVGTVAEAALAWAVLNGQGWRLLLLLSTLPLVLLLVLARWLPESPHWLLSQEDAAGAAAVLRGIASSNSKPRALYLHLPELTAAAAEAAAATSQQQQPADHADGSQAGAHPELAALLPGPNSSVSGCSTQHHALHIQHTGAQPDAASSLDQCQQQPSSSLPPAKQQAARALPAHQHQQGQEPTAAQAGWQPGATGSLPTLLAEVRQALGMLWGGPHAFKTSLLVFSWAAVACTYYGLVQLDGQLHIQAAGAEAAGSRAGAACINGKLQVPSSDYAAVVTTAAAEVPAVAWAVAASRAWGGNTALVASLALGCACLLPSIIDSVLHAGDAHAAGIAGSSWSSNLTELSMFGSRLFVSAAFSLLWVFTPSHFPTRVRGFGLGISNASGRIGGLLSPFVAINLVALASPAAAEALFAGLCLAAAAAVMHTHHQQGAPEQQLEEE